MGSYAFVVFERTLGNRQVNFMIRQLVMPVLDGDADLVEILDSADIPILLQCVLEKILALPSLLEQAGAHPHLLQQPRPQN